jgi:flagellar biosynthesis protein FlhA
MARRALARLLRPHLSDAPVLSYLEIPDGKPVEVVAVVGGGAPSRPQLPTREMAQ